MAKDINVHIKATGGAEAKQQLEDVAQGAQKVGSGIQDMGSKALIGSGWVQKALSFLAGPLAFAGITGAIAGATLKIAQFFDQLKTRSDEAVQHVQQIRASFAELFEVMDVFSEKSRQALTLETTALLQRTAVTQQAGLPVVTAYAREFQPFLKRGEITQSQYQQGLEQMLRYAGRQGAGAVPEMAGIMAGWGMITPEKQGAFRRMVTEAAQASGLTEEELIGALGRGMPTIKAMGWTPERALTAVATLAQGETGRKRAALPATTLQALMGGEIPKELQKQIPKELGGKPQELFAYMQALQRKMPRQDYLDLLTKLYGAEAAPGILKLAAAPPRGLYESIAEAAGPAGASREAQQERQRLETMEAYQAKGQAIGKATLLRRTPEEILMEAVRTAGIDIQEDLRTKEPLTQAIREFFQLPAREKEAATYNAWVSTLTPEQKASIRKRRGLFPQIRWKEDVIAWSPYAKEWLSKTPAEKFTAAEEAGLTITSPPEIHYHHDTIFNPVVGNKADLMGPRTPKGIH
jgi:hypothetical protein